MKNLMWRLLRRNVSVGQMVGFAIANLVGLTIVVLARYSTTAIVSSARITS